MGNEKLGAPFAQNSTVVEFVPNNGVGIGISMRSSLPSKCRALALTELLVADTSKSYVDSLQSSFKIEIIAVWVVAELGEKVTVNAVSYTHLTAFKDTFCPVTLLGDIAE